VRVRHEAAGTRICRNCRVLLDSARGNVYIWTCPIEKQPHQEPLLAPDQHDRRRFCGQCQQIEGLSTGAFERTCLGVLRQWLLQLPRYLFVI